MDTQQLAQQFIDALHRLEDGTEADTSAIVALFSDDARLLNAALKLAGKEHHGRAGVEQFWREYRNSFDQARSEFAQVTTNATSAGLFWTTTGTDNAGQPLAYDGVSLLVFDQDGKIAQFRGYYDTRELSRQVSGAAG